MKAIVDVTYSDKAAKRMELEVAEGLAGKPLLDAVDRAVEEELQKQKDDAWAGWQLVSVDSERDEIGAGGNQHG